MDGDELFLPNEIHLGCLNTRQVVNDGFIAEQKHQEDAKGQVA